MSVRRSRASLWSVTRICCRMISAEVIGRRARPGETGPDVWLNVRPIMGCVPDDIRLALSPNAFLIMLPMTLPPGPPLGTELAIGDDTSPPSATPPRAPEPPYERQDMKKISYAVSRSSTGPRASTRPKGAVEVSRSEVEVADVRPRCRGAPGGGARALVASHLLPARPSHRERVRARARARCGVRGDARGLGEDRARIARAETAGVSRMTPHYFCAAITEEPRTAFLQCFAKKQFEIMIMNL
jgi:hypothetical protein